LDAAYTSALQQHLAQKTKPAILGGISKEDVMAKGQVRTNKEKRKPKKEDPKKTAKK
jgi:hypothetical protein